MAINRSILQGAISVTLSSEIKPPLIEGLERLLDGRLRAQGFSRLPSSVVYRRALNGATQKIDLAIEVHPKDRPDSAAAPNPWMEVLVPHVDRLLNQMIDGDLGLMEGVTRGTSRQPIETTSGKAMSGRWFVFQPDSIPGVIEGIAAFLELWTLPLLGVYSTAEEILAVDEADDSRVLRDRAQMMRVIAAALAANRKVYAEARLAKWFGAPGARRRYQRIFSYVESAT